MAVGSSANTAAGVFTGSVGWVLPGMKVECIFENIWQVQSGPQLVVNGAWALGIGFTGVISPYEHRSYT